MPTYIALLRGINVSGQKLIKMAELQAHFQKFGATKVRTYIQSGNVVFEHRAGTPASLRPQLERFLESRLGHAVPTLVKSARELAAIAKDAGKLPKSFEIPRAYRENFPERVTEALKPAREAGLLPSFPFGTDFTEVEQRLIPALQLLREAQRTRLRLPGLLWQGITQPPDAGACECLARLGLDRPKTFAERGYRALVNAALARSAAG